MKNYIIEIYQPGSSDDVVQTFESDHPFVGLNKGDIINPAFFSSYDRNPDNVLRIKTVEHIFWQHEGQDKPKQKLLIFTEEIPNNRSERVLKN